jgi:hypothetical protein
METVTALIGKTTEMELLTPIGNCNHFPRVSIFADDVVLFVKPSVQDLVVVREILDVVGVASGLKVNLQKTSATLIRGGAVEEELVSRFLGCAIGKFPLRYLGLQLSLGPLTRAQWQPMLDAAIRIIPAWQRGMIARAGRLTLVKSVMAARPVHHLLIAEAPIWVLEEIERSLKGFFWAGKERATGGQCLVAWNQIAKPQEFGGLGVKNLRLHGLALRVRWEWLRRTDQNRPWQSIQLALDSEAREVFDSLVRISVGNGRNTLFWRDRWIQGRKAADFAPGLTQTVSKRARNSRTVQQGLVDNRWILDFSGNMAAQGVRECIALWLAIQSVDRDSGLRTAFTGPGRQMICIRPNQRTKC